jgi:hypothetical protein
VEGFEPPKYISSLIASVNDGAKAAQAGALAFSALGLFLIATAISTTDEDLLLEHTTTISQIGVQVPAVFSFAIAPVVFVAIHLYTLIRYDMLSSNMEQLRHELSNFVPLRADQERCWQLLANVEFIQAFSPPEFSLYSQLFGWVARTLLAIFPVVVLLSVQISFLRYQSDEINWVQRIVLLIDLGVLVWFFQRQAVRRGRSFWFGAGWPVLVAALSVAWLRVPGPDAATVTIGKQYAADPEGRWASIQSWSGIRSLAAEAAVQPLDLLLCPTLGWGCRYIKVDHRTLLGRVWVPQAIVKLRSNEANLPRSISGIDGAYLRHRSLRFANFSDSALYGLTWPRQTCERRR